jgi:hypothetical protein
MDCAGFGCSISSKSNIDVKIIFLDKITIPPFLFILLFYRILFIIL